MFISEIVSDKYILVNLQMEQAHTRIENYTNQVINVEQLVRENQSHSNISNILMEPALIRIKQYLELNPRLIIMDFEGIIKFDNKAEDMLVMLVEKYKEYIIIMNLKENGIRSEIREKIYRYENILYYNEKIDNLQIEGVNTIENKNVYEEHYKQAILNIYKSTEIHDLKVNGSRIIYSNYIDMKKIVVNNKLLFQTAFLLAIKLIKSSLLTTKVNGSNPQKPVLFFQSLNGASITSIISILLGLDISYIDHLGPINQLHKINFKNNIKDNMEYIVVADVISLGNELNRAKNIIEYSGGNYRSAITIMNIDSINGQDDEIISLININKEAAIELNYGIKTSLCPCQEVYQHGE